MTELNIIPIINNALDSQQALLSYELDRSLGDQTPIFGEEGQIDSLGLVSMIVEIEEVIEVEYGIALVLASERAMSARRSPFATVSSFANYIQELIKDASHV